MEAGNGRLRLRPRPGYFDCSKPERHGDSGVFAALTGFLTRCTAQWNSSFEKDK
jgi:hypothetical protein